MQKSTVVHSLLLALALALAVAVGCAKPLPTQEPLPVSPLQFSQTEWRVVDQVFGAFAESREHFPSRKMTLAWPG